MNSAFLSLETGVSTPSRYVHVDDLAPGDELTTSAGRAPVESIETCGNNTGAFAVSFSTGDTIVTAGKQLWRTQLGDSSSTEDMCQQLSTGEKSFYNIGPNFIDCGTEPTKVFYDIVSTDPLARRIFNRHGSEHSVTLIAHAYADIINGVDSVGFSGYIHPQVRQSITAKYGAEFAELLADGKLPDWFFALPLADRVSAVGIIIDSVKKVRFEQSKRCTYATISANLIFHDDITFLFSQAGCTKEISYLESDNLKKCTFSLNEKVKSFSQKIQSTFPGQSLSLSKFSPNNVHTIVGIEELRGLGWPLVKLNFAQPVEFFASKTSIPVVSC